MIDHQASQTRSPWKITGNHLGLVRLIAMTILILAWALYLFRLDFQDIWWDEARNIDVATRPLAEIAGSPELDIHPPLYFYALHIWSRLSGVTTFSLRYFSLWWGVLTAVLTLKLGQGLGRGQARHQIGLVAMAVAAFSPYALAEAQETRMYTISWAILAAGMLFLWRAIRPSQSQDMGWFTRWGGVAVMVVMALLTHYATLVVLCTWGIWLLIWALASSQRRRRLRALLGLAAIILIGILPVVPIAWRQIPAYDNPNLTLPSLSAYLSQLGQAFTVGEHIPQWMWPAGGWAWGVLVIGGGVLVLVTSRLRQRTQWWRWSLLMTWLLGGLALFYGILVARSAFNPRYISFILPALWALAGWGIWGWRRIHPQAPWLVATLLIILISPSLWTDLTDPVYFREDARGVVSYLQAHTTPEDVILVDQRYPFGFYWERWNNDFDGLPPSQPSDQAPAQYVFVDLRHNDDRGIAKRLTTLAGNARRVFWVTWFESDMDPRGAVKALLDVQGISGDKVNFRGYTVDMWEMQPPVVFSLGETFAALNITFSPGIELVGGDWTGRTTPVSPGQQALVSLRWRTEGPTVRPLKVSLRLHAPDGAVVAQDDRLLLSDRHLRTTAWGAEEEAINVYSLSLPEDPGEYFLRAVVYDENTLEAVGLGDGRGIEASLGMLRITPAAP